MNPTDTNALDKLAESLKAQGEIGTAITVLKTLMQQFGPDLDIRNEVFAAQRAWSEDHSIVPITLVELFKKSPYDPELRLNLIQTCNMTGEQTEINTWQSLVHMLPHDTWLQDRLSGVYDRAGDLLIAIAGWADLIIHHEHIPRLCRRLLEACD